jgi:hypothetical protein
MFVKPGPRQDDRDRQLVVRCPNGRCLSPIGENVPETQFWLRRLRDKDVVPAVPIPISAVVRRIGPDGHAADQEAAANGATPEKIGVLIAVGEDPAADNHSAEPGLVPVEEHDVGVTA